MDDESSVRSSAVRGNFTSGRRPLASSSSVPQVIDNRQFIGFLETKLSEVLVKRAAELNLVSDIKQDIPKFGIVFTRTGEPYCENT